jgi:hypothetical protein
MAEPKVMQLREPIVLGKGDHAKVIEELTFQPFKARFILGLPTGYENRLLELISRHTGHDIKAIGELGRDDLEEAEEIIAGFHNPSPRIGEGSPPG